MPGPVSDSFDPEFGTGENARDVVKAIESTKKKITRAIGSEDLKEILEIVHGRGGRLHGVTLSEKELRIIRFAMNRAVESI